MVGVPLGTTLQSSIGVLDGVFDWVPLVVSVLGSLNGVPQGSRIRVSLESLIRAPDWGPGC